MKKRSRIALFGLGLPLLMVAAFAANAIAAVSTPVATTLEFEELEKGATFAYVDNAPKSELRHGFPKTISAGDQLVIVHPLAKGSKTIGHISVACTATKTSKSFDAAGFLCQGTFEFGNGTLIASATIGSPHQTEGAITGGTGAYAGTSGTFVSKEGGQRSKVTVSLLE